MSVSATRVYLLTAPQTVHPSAFVNNPAVKLDVQKHQEKTKYQAAYTVEMNEVKEIINNIAPQIQKLQVEVGNLQAKVIQASLVGAPLDAKELIVNEQNPSESGNFDLDCIDVGNGQQVTALQETTQRLAKAFEKIDKILIDVKSVANATGSRIE